MSKKENNVKEVISLRSMAIPAAILVGCIVIAVGIYFSSMRSSSNDTKRDTDSETTNEQPAEEQGPVPVQTTIDDDPIFGDIETAEIAIVEFSDYECPFCKRHFEETLPKLKEKYIDTGKAIFVFRDYPLSFHDPLATQEAEATECVADLGGDEKFWQYHDLIFETTTSNGNGLEVSDLTDLAVSVGIDENAFKSCFDSEKFADEVKKDIADGSSAGISGTPGFVVGKLSADGTVDGFLIAGAYPFETFESVIEEQLSN